MAYNWNWQIFLQPSATGEGTYIDWLLQGLQWTLMLSLSSWVIALLVGSLVGVLRTVPNRWLSGLALGLTLSQVYRHVMLPMAYRIIVPPLTSEFLNIFKNSAVATTIGLIELSRQAQQLVDFTAQPYEAFIAVTLLYVIINVTVMFLMRRLERAVQVPGYIGGK